jgi:hypothetical protein
MVALVLLRAPMRPRKEAAGEASEASIGKALLRTALFGRRRWPSALAKRRSNRRGKRSKHRQSAVANRAVRTKALALGIGHARKQPARRAKRASARRRCEPRCSDEGAGPRHRPRKEAAGEASEASIGQAPSRTALFRRRRWPLNRYRSRSASARAATRRRPANGSLCHVRVPKVECLLLPLASYARQGAPQPAQPKPKKKGDTEPKGRAFRNEARAFWNMFDLQVGAR